MSADNYFLVRPHGDKFVVTMEFASCEKPSPIDGTSAPTFDTRLEALDYAHSQWAEYGVVDASVTFQAASGSLIEGVEELIAQCVPTDALDSAWIRQSAEEIISLVASSILDGATPYDDIEGTLLHMRNSPGEY